MRKSNLLLSLLLLTVAASAQELTLFEPVETQTGDDRPQVGGPLVNQNGQPAYTLHSTVRIGDSVSVTLVDRQGKKIIVPWKPGQRAPLPGAGGYAIEDIQQRTVILSLPGNDPCLAAAKQGVSCLNASRARLALATSAPVPLNAQGPQPATLNGAAGQNPGVMPPQNPFEAAIQAQQAAQAAGGVPVPVPGAAPGVFVNPFNGRTETVDQGSAEQQAARDARQRARADRLSRFEPNRIPDNQVPQGMRRVTTPFGDRLVPAQGE